MTWANTLVLEPLMQASFELEEGIDIGNGPFGRKAVFQVKSGEFEFVPTSKYYGVKGDILPGSADYSLYGGDRKTLRVDVRGVLRTTHPKGLHMIVQYATWVELDATTIERLGNNEIEVDFPTSRFITQPQIEVLQPLKPILEDRFDLQRLSLTAIVAHGKLSRRRIDYRMYEVVNPGAPL